MQMVRELEMDRKTRALAGQTSSIPAWISDRKAVPAHDPGIHSATKARKTFAKPPAGIKAGSKIGSARKAHAIGRLCCRFHGFEHTRCVSAHISVPFCRTGHCISSKIDRGHLWVPLLPSPSPLPFFPPASLDFVDASSL